MKKIPLTLGTFALVNDEDYDVISKYKWGLDNRGYASRMVRMYMHKQVLSVGDGLKVDHINRDKLDNQRSNLRAATDTQNKQNRCALKNSKSGLKGVDWHPKSGKWRSRISIPSGKRLTIGSYNTMIAAAKAYNMAAMKYHGEFAYFNPI